MVTIDLTKYPTRLAAKNICVNLSLDIEPVSKARPRFTRTGHAYTPRKTSEYENYLGWKFKEAVGGIPDDMSYFGVRAFFSVKNRKRIDVDNLCKAVLDAANGIVWNDDRQVRELTAKLMSDNGDSVSIVIYRLIDDSGISTCPHCGKQFHRPPSTRGTYCSKQCADDARRKLLVCKECGKEYTLPQSLAKKRDGFCSRSCASKWWHKHSPKAPAPQTKCLDCGKPLSRREYTRCLACAIEYRRAHSTGCKSFQDFVKPHLPRLPGACL